MRMIIVYTGNGKGKTTAAVGLAVRAKGAGKSVKVVKFMKGNESSEDRILEEMGISVRRYGLKRFVDPKNPAEEDFKEARMAWEEAIGSEEEVLILDEINVALMFGLLSDLKEEMLEISKNRTVVCTGRGAPAWLIEIADIVTEMKEVKHWFNEGKPAVRGIDY